MPSIALAMDHLEMKRLVLVAVVLSGCATDGAERTEPLFNYDLPYGDPPRATAPPSPSPPPLPPTSMSSSGDQVIAKCKATLAELAAGPADDSPEAAKAFLAKVEIWKAREASCDALMADARAEQGRRDAQQESELRATDRRLSREMAEHDRRAANAAAVGNALQQAGRDLQQAARPTPTLKCTPDPLAVVPGSMTCR